MSSEKKYERQFKLGMIKKKDKYLFDKEEAKVAVDLELNNLVGDYREYVKILEGMIENKNDRIFFDDHYMRGIELFFEAYTERSKDYFEKKLFKTYKSSRKLAKVL